MSSTHSLTPADGSMEYVRGHGVHAVPSPWRRRLVNLDVYPTVPADRVAWITAQEMIEVDRVMIEDLHIELIQMMENAGRNLARVAIDVFGPSSVAVAAGSGGNGGGGLVAARHLANAGLDVTVTTSRPVGEITGVPAHQLGILRRMGVPVSDTLSGADVTIDALIGYSLRGAPHGHTAGLIEQITSRRQVLALDTPSGLDVDTGESPGVVVGADVTMTLALPKAGLRGAPDVGALLLADISVPRSVTAALGANPPDFRASPVVRLV